MNLPTPLDSPLRTLEHAKIIQEKYFLRKLYTSWYEILFREIPDYSEKRIVELGSGGGFLKKLAPEVITSDFLDLPSNDMCFSALQMPFENSQLDGIFMIDTFHHLPDVEQFLMEANRTLRHNAKLIMVEPANSHWGRWVYQNFHHEPFDPSGDWKIPASGPLSGANGALPWIVFERDHERFAALFPNFEIKSIQYHTPFTYLTSGGVSMYQLLPDFCYSLIRFTDQLASKITNQASMFMTVVIQKI
ncbi:MAG: class I SAM-dependent methyltransferase [Saprospiraceae bacterium]|nr:class I SAM-dependent methyltransferase [Saprospiraceae bacterium]